MRERKSGKGKGEIAKRGTKDIYKSDSHSSLGVVPWVLGTRGE